MWINIKKVFKYFWNIWKVYLSKWDSWKKSQMMQYQNPCFLFCLQKKQMIPQHLPFHNIAHVSGLIPVNIFGGFCFCLPLLICLLSCLPSCEWELAASRLKDLERDNPRTRWWTQKMKRAIKEKTSSYQAWLACGTPVGLAETNILLASKQFW